MTLAQIRVKIPILLAEHGVALLNLTNEVLEMEAFQSFMRETLGIDSLPLKEVEVTEKSDRLILSGRVDILNRTNLAAEVEFSGQNENLPPIIGIRVAWPSASTLTFGNYSIEQIQILAKWLREDEQGAPLFYGAVRGIMRLGSVNADVQISFPEAPGTAFISGAFENLAVPSLSQLAGLVKVPELAQWLPAPLANASGLALKDIGVMAGISPRKVTFVSATVAALGWSVIDDVLALRDLEMSLMVENPGAGLAISAELYAALQVGSVKVPLFIGVEPGEWTVNVATADSVALPSFSDLLSAIGGTDLAQSLPPGFDPAIAIGLDTLEMRFDPTARKLNSVRFYINLDWEIVKDSLSISEAFLEMDIVYDHAAGTKTMSGSVGGALLVGETGIPLSASFDETGSVLVQMVSDEPLPLPTLQDLARVFPGNIDYNSFLPEGLSLSSGLEIGDFEFDIQKDGTTARRTAISVLIGFPGTFTLVDGLSLGNLALNVTRVKDTAPGPDGRPPTNDPVAQTSAEFVGTLGLGQVNFVLSATKPADPADGWAFSGDLEEGSVIKIADLLRDIASAFGFPAGDLALPDYIETLAVTAAGATFNSKSKDFTFYGTCEFDLRDIPTTITVRIAMERKPPSEQQPNQPNFRKSLRATIVIGEREFDLHFVTEPGQQTFLATYRKEDGEEISLLEILASVTGKTKEELLDEGLPDPTLTLNAAMFGYNKSGVGQAAVSKYVFGVNISAGLAFDSLPLIGRLPEGMSIGLDGVQFTYTTGEWTKPQLSKINQAVNLPSFRLPEPQDAAGKLASGVQLAADLLLGPVRELFSIPLQSSSSASGSASAPAPAQSTPSSASDGVKWFDINRRLGPLKVDRIGLAFQDGLLWLFLDSDLTLGPLVFILDGLSVGTPITKFAPEFRLRGFGLQYKSGPTEIGGYFTKLPDSEEYAGIAVLKASKFTLSAIGAYQSVNGQPSFYIYAFLDYPLGGPSFFFITGLAMGFGYNRTIREPSIEEVADFPFVQLALGTLTPANFSQVLARPNFIPVRMGSIFLAFGLRFTSFKLIDSFLLLLVRIEKPFRIDLLGISQIIVPTPLPGVPPQNQPTPVAKISLAVKGTFIPEEGFLGIEAQLTRDSFIISRDARLTGGFAFYSWFSGPHQGDFVLSLGGYHPDFRPPSHYPVVPRLGLNWRVSSKLTVKGSMYFALVPSAVMAGGSLQATYQDGRFKAWFRAGADFLISWKPYFYDIRIYINVGASYTFWAFGWQTISIDVGAKLHIWGPEFSGTAEVDVKVATITVRFGAGAVPYKPPIDWNEFKESFLPKKDVCSIQIQSGLVRTLEVEREGQTVEYWVINPKELTIQTDSVIPVRRAFKGEEEQAGGSFPFGIAPMAVSNAALNTTQTINITRKDNMGEVEPANSEFMLTPVRKPIPSALWGQKFKTDLNGERMIPGALSGFEIRPAANPQPGVTTEILQQQLQFDTELAADGQGGFQWEAPATFQATGGDVDLGAAAQQRRNILEATGFTEDDFNLTLQDLDEFLAAPAVGSL